METEQNCQMISYLAIRDALEYLEKKPCKKKYEIVKQQYVFLVLLSMRVLLLRSLEGGGTLQWMEVYKLPDFQYNKQG